MRAHWPTSPWARTTAQTCAITVHARDVPVESCHLMCAQMLSGLLGWEVAAVRVIEPDDDHEEEEGEGGSEDE